MFSYIINTNFINEFYNIVCKEIELKNYIKEYKDKINNNYNYKQSLNNIIN